MEPQCEHGVEQCLLCSVKSVDAIIRDGEEINRLRKAIPDFKAEIDRLRALTLKLASLLEEWMHTPYFGKVELWEEWVQEFRPRVQRAIDEALNKYLEKPPPPPKVEPDDKRRFTKGDGRMHGKVWQDQARQT